MNNVSYGAVKDVVPKNVNEKLPENLQNLDAAQVVNNNGAVATANNMNKNTALMTLPFYLSFVALRSANDSVKSPFTFSGEYEKSFLGKLSKFGDGVSKVISKIIPDNIEYAIPKKMQQAKTWLCDHSAIARSFTTPLKLENSSALSEANGIFGRVMYDNSTLFEKGFKGDVKALFKGDGTSSFWNLLKSKGIESADNDGALKIVTDAFKDFAQKPVKSKEVQQYADDIIEALSKSNEKAVISKWGKFPIGKIPIIGKFFTLEVPMSEVANKLKVTSGKGGATAIGCALPSAFAKIYEGITSNFVGGKMAPALQAYFLASAAMRAKDAPEGQRLATFMDEEAGGVATLFTLPLATKILTSAGGLKYLGMGKNAIEQDKNVQMFRDMVKALNNKVDAGTITRTEYLDEAKKIKDVLKGDTKFWQKPFKALGRILGSNYKNETIKPFLTDSVPEDFSGIQKLGISFSNKIQDLVYKFKTGGMAGFTPGGVLRFALVMFVLSPILSKPIRAVINKIFGKPYDPQKEKQELEKKQQEEMMKNNPFLKMSDQELLTLLSSNQDTLQKIQNDPKLMQELQTNPQKLYDILQEGVKKKQEALQKAGPSPMLRNYINNGSGAPTPNAQTATQTQNFNPNGQIQPSSGFYQPNMQQNMTINNNGMNLNTEASMPKPSVKPQEEPQKQETKPIEPQRSYIPSSKPADFSAQQSAQDAKFQALLNDMENTEKEYSKYLGI